MKEKKGFIMFDYAFPRKLKSKRGMATRINALVARTTTGLDPVGKVRVVQRV